MQSPTSAKKSTSSAICWVDNKTAQFSFEPILFFLCNIIYIFSAQEISSTKKTTKNRVNGCIVCIFAFRKSKLIEKKNVKNIHRLCCTCELSRKMKGQNISYLCLTFVDRISLSCCQKFNFVCCFRQYCEMWICEIEMMYVQSDRTLLLSHTFVVSLYYRLHLVLVIPFISSISPFYNTRSLRQASKILFDV